MSGEVKEFKCPECDYVMGSKNRSFNPPFCPVCKRDRDKLVTMEEK